MNDPGISVITTNDISYDKLLGPLPVVTNIMDTMVLLGLRCLEVRQTTQQIKVDPKDCDTLASGNRYFHWLFYVQSARDDSEQNLELITKHGQLYYQAIRNIKAGEELLVWFNKELAEVFQVPDLGEFLSKDEGKRRCPYCNDVFSYPNPLKSHLMYRCDKRLAEVHGINSVNRLQLESINRLQLDWYSAAMFPMKPSSFKGFAVSTLTNDFIDMYRRVAPSITVLSGEKENARHQLPQLIGPSDQQTSPMSTTNADYETNLQSPNGTSSAPRGRTTNSSHLKRKAFDVTLHSSNDSTNTSKRLLLDSPPMMTSSGKRLSTSSMDDENDMVRGPAMGKVLMSGIIKVDATRRGDTVCATTTETTQVALVQQHQHQGKNLSHGAGDMGDRDTSGSAFKKVRRPSTSAATSMATYGGTGSPFSMNCKPVYPIGYSLPLANSTVGAPPHPPTASSVTISAGSWSVPAAGTSGPLNHFTTSGNANNESHQSHPSPGFSGVVTSVPSSYMQNSKMAESSTQYSSIKFLEDIRPQPSSMALTSRTAVPPSNGPSSLHDGSEASTVTVSYRNTLYPDSMYRLSVGLPYAAAKQFNNFVHVRAPSLPAITAAILPPSLTPLAFPAQNWCAKCNATFRMTSDLVYHMRSHHKRDVDPLKKKREEKLKCNICNESFRERHHLTRHMTSHQ